MRINRIFIENFGKLKNFELEFNQGMNIVFGNNEDGKSTIMAFIEMMFYGKTAQEKSTDISKSLRKKYTPWDGSVMAGDLEFSYEGKNYRIHKIFKKTMKSDVITLWDGDTGEAIPLGKDEEIGHRFFGIDVGSFEKSVYINGFGGFADQGQTNEDIALKLSNIVSTLDEDVSQSQVLGRITEAREKLRSKSGRKGILVDLETERAELKEQLEESRRLAEQQLRYKNRKEGLEARNVILQKQKAYLTELENRKKLMEEESALMEQSDRYTSLIKEGRILEEKKKAVQTERYNYDTFPKYLMEADELKSQVNAQKNIAQQYKSNISEEIKNVGLDQVGQARTLEAGKSRLLLLNDIISSSYQPALEDYETSLKAEKKAAELLEGLKEPAKTIFYIGIGSGAGAALMAALAVVISPLLWLAAGLLGIGAAIVIYMYVGKNHDFHQEQKHRKEILDQLTQERMTKNNKLYREKDKLFDKGGEYFSSSECDFKEIVGNEFHECCRKLAEIYDTYGVDGLSQLEEAASLSARNKSNADMYAEALEKQVELEKVFNSFTQGEDVEEVRVTCRKIKEDSIAFLAKTGQEGILEQETASVLILLEERLGKLTEERNHISHQLEELEAKLSVIQETEVVAATVEELEEEIRDVNEQLLEIVSLMNSSNAKPEEIESKIKDRTRKIEEKKELYEAILAAENGMQAAVDDISRSFGPLLNEKTAEIFSKITNGKYEKVMVDKSYGIQVREKQGTFHEWKFLSNGTTDQAYLALRLAMTDLITENSEKLPLMLDDILLQYDETRSRLAMNYLIENAAQVQTIMFTCRQPETLERVNFISISNL